MRKTLLALTILISLPAFSNENVAPIYLAKAEDGEKFLITESSSYNISGKLDNAALGLCISKDICTKHFNMSEAFVLKFTLIDEETREEFPINAKYDLNFPLYMNPDNDGFKNQYFIYTSLDLSQLPLCQPIDGGGDCSENQDLSYLLNL
jgi:hypothetical protein